MLNTSPNKSILLYLVCLCVCTNLSFAPICTDKKYQNSIWELPCETLNDTWRIVRSPLKWQGRDWLIAGGATVITGAAFFADEPLQEYMQSHQSPAADGVAAFIGQPLGNAWYVTGASLVSYAVAKGFRNEKVAQPSLLVFKSVLITNGATTVIKFLAHRERPEEGNPPSPDNWFGPSFDNEHLSFVSSHSATAFAIASSLSVYYDDHNWVPFVAYPLAGVTAWSRMYQNRHWFSDVVAGAILGTFVGRTVAQPQKYQWSYGPNNFGGNSLSFTYNF